MGRVAKIIAQGEVGKPLFNRRACIDLCENVHLHYRNLRLEFPKEEFLALLDMLRGLDPKEIANFPYAPEAFKEAARIELPETTEFDSRLVVEEQVEGHYHVHYRNLRIELGEMKCPGG
jgi:hypothetical protein